MNERNLPLKLVLQRKNDSKKKKANGGGPKEIEPLTKAMQDNIKSQLQNLESLCSNFFESDPKVPQVAKITMKEKALSKSNKPNRFCKNLPIIGTENLGEIYVKVTPKGLEKAIKEVDSLPSKDFKANLTAIKEISLLDREEKVKASGNEQKVKVINFDFQDESDNLYAKNLLEKELKNLGIEFKHRKFSHNAEFYEISLNDKNDLDKISSIVTVKSINDIGNFSSFIKQEECSTDIKSDLLKSLKENLDDFEDIDEVIGIIDSGIADIDLLADYVVAREEYVPPLYQNRNHGTFVASMIQYGDELNDYDVSFKKRVKFVDIIAIPNGDKDYGLVDTLNEVDFMEIIRNTMDKYSGKVKIWNLSLGTNVKCDETMSTLGAFLDDIQREYGVQFILAAGNIDELPLRSWPADEIKLGEHDRITVPSDSVHSIVVGSVAGKDSIDAIVAKNEPSPFSRRGPGANFMQKPDLVDYGGNYNNNYSCLNLGMMGLNASGDIVEGVGTSYSAPRVTKKLNELNFSLLESDMLLSKALLVHSAKLSSTFINKDKDNQFIKYYGFGLPDTDSRKVLQNNMNEVTMIFKQKIIDGNYLELNPFPFPKSLIKDGKYYGEVFMTLAYNPKLDSNFGQEYSRVNLTASFGRKKGTYSTDVPLESRWSTGYEIEQVENGFKWAPLKSYYRKMKGIEEADEWKVRIDMIQRNEENILEQEFVLIITLRTSDDEIDLYSDMINGLRSNGYITQDLQTRYQLRQQI